MVDGREFGSACVSSCRPVSVLSVLSVVRQFSHWPVCFERVRWRAHQCSCGCRSVRSSFFRCFRALWPNSSPPRRSVPNWHRTKYCRSTSFRRFILEPSPLENGCRIESRSHRPSGSGCLRNARCPTRSCCFERNSRSRHSRLAPSAGSQPTAAIDSRSTASACSGAQRPVIRDNWTSIHLTSRRCCAGQECRGGGSPLLRDR